jgi:hypothetical protein
MTSANKLKGTTCHSTVNTLGLLRGFVVTPASVHVSAESNSGVRAELGP